MNTAENSAPPRVSVGRMVTIHHYETPINGTRFSPAIVTNVWGDVALPAINCTMFGDSQQPTFRGTVYHRTDKRAEGAQYVWDWPARG